MAEGKLGIHSSLLKPLFLASYKELMQSRRSGKTLLGKMQEHMKGSLLALPHPQVWGISLEVGCLMRSHGM